VVGVAGPHPGVVPLRAGADDAIRADLPDHPGEIPAQVQRGLDPAVRVAEEPHVVHAHAFGRRDLLGPPQGGHLGAGDVLVEPAGVAVGHQAVGDLDPRVGPPCDRARRAEVDVIGMRGNGQDPGDFCVVEHARHPNGRPS